MNSTITLRRSAKIRNRLTERLALISGQLRETASTVNIYDADISTLLAGRAEDYNELLVRFFAVSRTLHGIRDRIDTVNASHGVNGRLAEQVALMGQLRVMRAVADIREARPNDTTIHARIAGQLDRIQVSEYALDHMTFTFVTDAMIESAKEQVCEIQTRLDTIQEELESINATQKVSLTEMDLAVLQQERIV